VFLIELFKKLNIKKGDVVSIVGAGGKTTLMFSIATELKDICKILICTTTKIFIPLKNQFDYFYIGDIPVDVVKNGRYLFGSSIKSKKILSILEEDILKYKPLFDIILIEADGARMKSIKGWKEHEPVVSSSTTKTIGVVDILNIGKVINEENVHNIEEFMDITGSTMLERINLSHIVSMINSPKGLFKNSIGEKIIYIPKNDPAAVNELLKSLNYSIKVVT